MTSTVWVVQDPIGSGRNFEPAYRFGKLDFLLSAEDKPSRQPGACYLKVLVKLKKLYRTGDYIVQAGGDPLAPILVGFALGTLGYKSFNVLRWERNVAHNSNGQSVRTGGYYVPIEITLGDSHV